MGGSKSSVEPENKEVNIPQKGKGLAQDLVDKLDAGELTPKKIKEEMKKLGFKHETSREKATVVVLIVCIAMMYLPIVARLSNLDALAFAIQLPVIELPFIVRVVLVIVGIVLLSLALLMVVWAGHLLSAKGGLRDGHESIKFLREGPYKVIRHPIGLGMFFLFGLSPLIFSGWVPYNSLTIIGQVILFASLALEGRKGEEEANIRKWGDEYRRYQKEVPRFNFMRGLFKQRRGCE